MEEPISTFNGWSAIIHCDKEGNPVWFSYYVWGYYLNLSVQMEKDLSAKYGQQLIVYDIFGMEGNGTARIRIISPNSISNQST